MTTIMIARAFAADAGRLESERKELLDALADVMRYADLYHPCGHDGDPCCAWCHARDLLRRYGRG